MGNSYIIAGGVQGAARLSVLTEVMAEFTGGLLDRAGVPTGGLILDAGCGVGEVSRDLLRRAGPDGRVVGLDLDAEKIAVAARNAPPGLSFHVAGLETAADLGPFDLIYARFLLSHLTDPAGALSLFHRALKPGGLVVVEDVEFTAHLCVPPRPAFDRYVAGYQAAASARGADANIGPRLPGLLAAAGFGDVQARLVQPAGLTGPVKAIAALTLSAIGPSLPSHHPVAADLADLEAARDDPSVFMSLPRITQAWGRRVALPGAD